MNALAPWQQRVYDKAAEALDAGRLPHALLLAGPAELGKRAVAEKLARRALCLARAPGAEACGECRSCHLFDSRAQTDPPEQRPDGSLAHPSGHPAHPDARFIGYGWNEKTHKPRGEIVIEQIRTMSEKLALTPQYGEHQVAILDPADAINHAAANALLKTLEEPQPGRFIWLISARPARLPATIRSRTQVLEFRLPPRDEALAWLAAQGHPASAAAEALKVAHGHPGLAHHWLGSGALTLRAEVAKDLDGLRRDAAPAAALAQRWVGDEHAALRLSFAADLALEAARHAEPARTKRLAAWFDQSNRTRELLRTPVRADLAVLELLLAWHAAGRG
ncbi:DNA polymerase III subunit delta' [Lysobacter pythonis]|uniref:DNA-directed DNA polymerase n=1 Tax=Solilutibacter pythonis TaxID=2483112 RepID=A0A3M2HT41_9GAMM|nr:DNA polymerase III subunit delta' [Lysobacter pythonis]RMH90840.1 DNA polymerase III subunit delta' [Lysobacter pythonis]